MGWILAAGLALAAFGVLVLVFKAPRKGWEAIVAALLFGLAGFAFQARPDLAGAPKAAAADVAKSGKALVEARHQLSQGGTISGDRLLVTADALARNGSFGDAASLALGAAERNPGNADAWLAVANNLVAHADGALTPAAHYAYGRAIEADPRHPGPPFFLGLAMLQNGELEKGRKMWADLLARSPADAPWRADLQARLDELDRFLAERAKPGQ
ncbi:MAG: cytochrome C biosynthesis protein [Sphingomonadaceae bacterium]